MQGINSFSHLPLPLHRKRKRTFPENKVLSFRRKKHKSWLQHFKLSIAKRKIENISLISARISARHFVFETGYKIGSYLRGCLTLGKLPHAVNFPEGEGGEFGVDANPAPRPA